MPKILNFLHKLGFPCPPIFIPTQEQLGDILTELDALEIEYDNLQTIDLQNYDIFTAKRKAALLQWVLENQQGGLGG